MINLGSARVSAADAIDDVFRAHDAMYRFG